MPNVHWINFSNVTKLSHMDLIQIIESIMNHIFSLGIDIDLRCD